MDKKIRLNSVNNLNSVNVDQSTTIELVSKSNILPTNEYNVLIDETEIFKKERDNCDTYRLSLNFNTYFTNVLFNLSGVDSLETFTTSKLLDASYPPNNSISDDEDLTFDKVYNEKLLEEDGWFFFQKNDKAFFTCEKNYLKPYPSDLELTNENWDLTITYPFENKSEEGDITYNGLQIIDSKVITVGGVDYIAFATPVKHGLIIGDRVKLKGLIPNSIDGEYTVISLGLDNKILEEYYFIVDLTPTLFVSLSNNTRMVRTLYGVDSKYYFRILKKVPTTISVELNDNDYELYDLSFGQTIYSDTNKQFTLNTEIDLSNLVDNLGRPVKEIFLTLIRKGNKIFSSNNSGLEVPNYGTNGNFLNVPDIRRIHNGGTIPFQTHVALENNVTINNTEFYCDVCEYNEKELFEKVLGDVNYRFSNLNREEPFSVVIDGVETTIDGRYEGYFYKAHYQIKLKGLSNYIEEDEKNNVVNIPTYAQINNDGTVIWREVLDRGINDIDGDLNDYPFVNGHHFIFKTFNVFLKRQDPFNDNGLFTSTYPSDQFGSTYNDNYLTITPQNAC